MPARNKTVAVAIESVPTDLEVRRGEEVVGHAPGPIVLPHGDEAITLTLAAAGYQPKTVELIPDADKSVSVTLTPVSPKSPPAKKKKLGKDDWW